jgi:hypothetical protein
MQHTDTLCGQNAVRTSQEKRYVFVREPNWLMLFGETVAVFVRTACSTQVHSVRKMQSVPHRKHVTSPLENPTG